MGLSVSHSLSATTPDDPSFEIRPSHWNSNHIYTLNAVGSEVSNAFGTNGNVTFTYDGTNINANAGTAAPSPVNVSAGTTSNNLQTIVFSNSNGLGFGLDGSTITGSYTQSTHSHSSLFFADSNGISWGTNASTVTGTVKTDYQSSNANYLTSQSNQNVTAGNGGFAFQTLSFSNANNFTFATSAGSAIVGSYTVPTVTNSSWTVSDSATSATVGRLAFTAANGITMTLSTSNNGNHTVFASYTVPTVTNSSWTVSDSATSGTVGRLAFTNLNGVTLSLSTGAGGSHTIVGSHNALTSQSNQAASASNGSFTFQTLGFSNANNVTFGTSAGSIVTASVAVGGGGGIAAGVSNTGTTAGNTGTASTGTIVFAGSGFVTASQSTAAGSLSTIWYSVPIPAVSNSAGSFTFSTLNFSNANNVTWGTSAGGIITASVAPPGAAAENNAINLLGNNTAGNTTATGSTIGWSGINLTFSGTNNSQVVVSAPATSSLVGTSGISISTNGSTISVLQLALQEYDPYPLYNGVSTAFATQAVGAWFVAPFAVDNPIAGGRINRMIVNGGTASLLRATTSASFQAATTGTKSAAYEYSNSVVLYSLGAGTNSTRLESFWSNQFSFRLSHSMSITSGAGATTLFVGESGSMSYLSAIDSAGNTTTNSFNSNGNATSNGSSINSTAISSVLNSVRNVLSGSMQIPVGFNTTINPGNYWMAQAWSTNSTTAGSSESVFSQASTIGVLMAQQSAFRMWPQTTTNVSSQYMPGRGVYSASQSNPPTTMAFSDIRTWASDIVPYFNFVNSQISV